MTEKDLIAANKEAVFGFPAAEWDDVSDGAKDLVSRRYSRAVVCENVGKNQYMVCTLP